MVKMVHLVFSPRYFCLFTVFCGSIQIVGFQFQFQCQGYFYRDHIKSVDCVGLDGHFNNTNSFNS